ncbi:MAG: hypothetical protein B6D68_01590 [spirochete symbiont of Stewartia floridana]|nr:MAG: hypothetical protein B6D68_01590 [spirochete symbiont of Stewartia floridana]
MKIRGIVFFSAVLLLVNFFLFPRISGRELILRPKAVVEFGSRISGVGGGPPVMGIQAANRVLFLDEDSRPVHYQEGQSVAVGRDWWAAVVGLGVEIHEPDGRLRSRIPIMAKPYARNDHLFLYNDANGVLHKIDPANGAVLWRREFLSILTVLDARGERSLVGLLDGRCLIVEDSGDVSLEYRPERSRVEAIYGGALSSDGKRLALVAGLEPQRFILLSESRNGFTLINSYETEREIRRYVKVDFVYDDALAAYESDDHVILASVGKDEIRRLEAAGVSRDWSVVGDTGTMAIYGMAIDGGVLKLFTHHDLTLFEGSLPAGIWAMETKGDDIFLIGEKSLGILGVEVY